MKVEVDMPQAEVLPYPTDFTDQPRVLDGGLGTAANEALKDLDSRGYAVLLGMSRDALPAIQAMAAQEHIGDYCIRDLTEDRFITAETAQHWLSKGRAFFVLARKLDNGEQHPVGYGWGGPGKSAEVPEGETTWAVRLGEEALGRKLSEPFSRVIVDATQTLFGGENVWLETWESNAAGVHTYGKLGFERVGRKPGTRLTASGKRIDDVRLFMKLG